MFYHFIFLFCRFVHIFLDEKRNDSQSKALERFMKAFLQNFFLSSSPFAFSFSFLCQSKYCFIIFLLTNQNLEKWGGHNEEGFLAPLVLVLKNSGPGPGPGWAKQDEEVHFHHLFFL